MKQDIVIDDGATDGTAALLEKWRDHREILVPGHPHNRGKGMTVRTGLAAAEGRFTIIQLVTLWRWRRWLPSVPVAVAQVNRRGRHQRAG